MLDARLPEQPPDSSGRIIRAVSVWFAGWVVCGLIFGPPIGDWWIEGLPDSLVLAVHFIPPIVMIATTVFLMAELAKRNLGKFALIVLGGVSLDLLVAGMFHLPSHYRPLAQGPLLILFGIATGLGLSRLVEKREFILPVLVVFSFVDLYSVFLGPTKAVMEDERGKELAELVMVTYPSAGGDAPLGVQSYFGWPDAVVMAMLLGVATQYGIAVKRTGITLGVGMLVVLTLAGVFGLGLPALPFLCLAFALANWKAVQSDKDSIKKLVIFVATLGAVFILARVLR